MKTNTKEKQLKKNAEKKVSFFDLCLFICLCLWMFFCLGLLLSLCFPAVFILVLFVFLMFFIFTVVFLILFWLLFVFHCFFDFGVLWGIIFHKLGLGFPCWNAYSVNYSCQTQQPGKRCFHSTPIDPLNTREAWCFILLFVWWDSCLVFPGSS